MDTIVGKLSEIEDAAVAIITHTDVAKKEYSAKIKNEQQIFDSELSEKTNKTINDIRAELRSNLDRELQLLKTNNEYALTAFQEEYDQHYESYAAQILKRITEV